MVVSYKSHHQYLDTNIVALVYKHKDFRDKKVGKNHNKKTKIIIIKFDMIDQWIIIIITD